MDKFTRRMAILKSIAAAMGVSVIAASNERTTSVPPSAADWKGRVMTIKGEGSPSHRWAASLLIDEPVLERVWDLAAGVTTTS